MSFATATNIVTMLFCVAVLVQVTRLIRCLKLIHSGALTEVVGALDVATAEARRVLGRLTEVLQRDVANSARTLDRGTAMIEELTVMTGIANAIAERIVDAAGASNRSTADAEIAGAEA